MRFGACMQTWLSSTEWRFQVPRFLIFNSCRFNSYMYRAVPFENGLVYLRYCLPIFSFYLTGYFLALNSATSIVYRSASFSWHIIFHLEVLA